jgi:DNA-binding transcriptional regulator YiaG
MWHCRDVLISSTSFDSNEPRLSIRDLRLRTGQSQRTFAQALGVSAETYRTWDSGRRPVPPAWVEKAKTLVDEHLASTEWHSLPALAAKLGVHRRTLEAAARRGRLAVRLSSRSVFGRPLQLATRAEGLRFKREHFRVPERTRPGRFAPLTLAEAPDDYAARVRGLRLWLDMTLDEFAKQIGAANKAVIYQWESGKRKPSPVFWERIAAVALRLRGRASDRSSVGQCIEIPSATTRR